MAHDSGIYDSLPSSRAYTAPTANAATITLPGTSITGQYLTLESHMEQWAQDNTSGLLSPSSVPVTDPSQYPAIALQEAQTYCAGYPVPDCTPSNIQDIAAKFGNVLKDDWSYFPASVWAAVKAANSSAGIPGAVAQVGDRVTVPALGIDYTVTQPNQAAQQFNSFVQTLPVPQSAQPSASQVNSAAANPVQTTANQQQTSSGGSLFSQIPSWAFLAAAGVVALMVFGGGK